MDKQHSHNEQQKDVRSVLTSKARDTSRNTAQRREKMRAGKQHVSRNDQRIRQRKRQRDTTTANRRTRKLLREEVKIAN
jgi:hypothetical protein